MSAGFFSTVSSGRMARLASLIGLLLGLALALPVASRAAVLAPWGSDLSATPSMDTADGDYGHTAFGPNTVIAPNPHSAEDLGVWNPQGTAPQGGQVLQIKVKGCAIEDTSSPTQQSPDGQGGTVPVDTIVFQTLSPQRSDWTATATTGMFQLPFCNSTDAAGNTVTPSYVSTYEPVHMCIAPGDQVAFHDVGGFVPNGTDGDNGGPWYPQGVPMEVIAPGRGGVIDSFLGVGTSTYGPGIYGSSDNTPSAQAQAGFATNSNEQVMLQVIEGTGDDAYGLCPGGNANEPANSNQVTCVSERASSGGYPTCNGNGQPVYWPAPTSAPTISGTAQEGQRLTEAHGGWTNSPYGYTIQWWDCDTSGANCQQISGADQQYYYPTAADVGHTLVVAEWATNDANTTGPATSAPTAVVTSGSAPLPPPVGPPQIAGLTLNPASFNAARGTTIVYTDNQSATATLKVVETVPGVMVGHSCLAPKPGRHGKRCKLEVTVKTIVHHDRAGSNGVKLSGVKPGHYVLEVKARIGGHSSQLIVQSFTARLVPVKGHSARHAHRA
jgi:hypothetical protein